MELLAELKEKVTEDFIGDVLQLEKLIDAFLTGDHLERNKKTEDKEDMLFILKQLAAEELLSPEQFEQLSEQMDLPTISLVIKDTKVGQGTTKIKRSGETFTDLARRFG